MNSFCECAGPTPHERATTGEKYCLQCGLFIKDIPAAVDSEEAAKKRGHYLNGDAVGRERKYDAPTAVGKESLTEAIGELDNTLGEYLDYRQEHHSKPPQPAPWEERFDKLFPSYQFPNMRYPDFLGTQTHPLDIKSFIAKELGPIYLLGAEEAREDLNKQLPEILAAAEKRGRDAACDYVLANLHLHNGGSLYEAIEAARAPHP